MHTVAALQERINREIASLKLPLHPAELYDPVTYILSLGGKRMRPVLTLMGCELFDGKIEDALPQALGIEIFHNFTLLHDDIMDRAPLRRSSPTVHEKWNVPVAILSGDAMFVKSCQLMMQCDPAKTKAVLELFYETALQVCEGQQLDMNFESRGDVSIPEYISMISLKTAVLPGAALKTGALVAGADAEDANHLYEFGKNIGVAFQLQDDILDLYANGEKFGKQTGGDIVANKKTFLLLKATELAKGVDAALLKNVFNEKEPEKKVTAAKSLFEKLGVRKESEKMMEHFHRVALEALQKVNVPVAKKQPLLDFAGMLMVREA